MEDFRGAALRHFSDAECLGADGRLDNASHLLGLAVECALKSAVLRHRGQDALPKDDRKHLPAMATVYRKAVGGRTPEGGSTLKSLGGEGSAFLDWKIGDRYRTGGHVDAALWAGRLTEGRAVFHDLSFRRSRHAP